MLPHTATRSEYLIPISKEKKMLGLGYDDDLARLKRDLAEAKAHEIIAARTKTPEARCKQIIETAPIESPLEHLAFKPPE